MRTAVDRPSGSQRGISKSDLYGQGQTLNHVSESASMRGCETHWSRFRGLQEMIRDNKSVTCGPLL